MKLRTLSRIALIVMAMPLVLVTAVVAALVDDDY